tara:strand:+ start:568 stop:813 length:246 start_codon:yes stop_codon:yes gene_type:complete
VFSHKLKILIRVVENIIIKKIMVDKVTKSLSFSILKVKIKNEKEEEILFGFVKDSINRRAEPIVNNSKSPLSKLMNIIPKN